MAELCVKYHIEEITGRDVTTHPLLSMETLNNDKPLFLANDPSVWYPFHLNRKENFNVLKVTFKLVESKTFVKDKEYHKLFHMFKQVKEETDTRYTFTFAKAGTALYDAGVRLFVLTDETDLEECFLCDPKDHVVSIERITHPTRTLYVFEELLRSTT